LKSKEYLLLVETPTVAEKMTVKDKTIVLIASFFNVWW